MGWENSGKKKKAQLGTQAKLWKINVRHQGLEPRTNGLRVSWNRQAFKTHYHMSLINMTLRHLLLLRFMTVC